MASEPSSRAREFAEFRARVVADPALLETLAATADPEAFIARAVELGAAGGGTFGADDVRAALQVARREWVERNLT